jgi:hypothetical protein
MSVYSSLSVTYKVILHLHSSAGLEPLESHVTLNPQEINLSESA